ncbi:MAG TPA: PP2C family protein-serine/threonine phosphatase [Candidatus Baltobacteraceae bacterium]|nr:PP2C family protein-serine/threonine phosphatase [Candidatus Baltobacteraceae bacterium]
MKTPTFFHRVRGTLVLSAFLLLTLGLAVQGAFSTRARIADTFAAQSQIVQAQLDLEEMLRLQIDEENSVRGFTSTRDPFYKDQYAAAVAGFDMKAAQVRVALQGQHLAPAIRTLDAYVAVQTNWRSRIAGPLLANPARDIVAIDKENKAFSDVEARAGSQISDTLAQANDRLGKSSQEEVNSGAWARAFWLALFGLLAVLFNGFRSRLVGELEEERTTTEILQRAFRSEAAPLPHCEVGSAYLSASSHLAVGGDVFDVYRLSDTLALVFIADVSGKGVDAAVLTAFIKFTIRGIALRRRDPGAMLAEFNTAFAQTVENPYLFVSMFVGILDTETKQFRYASAGHDSAFVRLAAGNVVQMAVTGPVLGVMEEPFETKIIFLEDGDTVVLTTDGLTEARRRTGEQLHEEGAMELIAQSSGQPQLLADELVAKVKALGGNQMRDDLAILAIRVRDGVAVDENA